MTVTEKRETDAMMTYILDRNLNVIAFDYGDILARLHKELEASGVLDHHLSTEERDQMKRIHVVKNSLRGSGHGASGQGVK